MFVQCVNQLNILPQNLRSCCCKKCDPVFFRSVGGSFYSWAWTNTTRSWTSSGTAKSRRRRTSSPWLFTTRGPARYPKTKCLITSSKCRRKGILALGAVLYLNLPFHNTNQNNYAETSWLPGKISITTEAQGSIPIIFNFLRKFWCCRD